MPSWQLLPSVGHALVAGMSQRPVTPSIGVSAHSGDDRCRAKPLRNCLASAGPALLSGVGREARSMMGFGELGRPGLQHVLGVCTVQGS